MNAWAWFFAAVAASSLVLCVFLLASVGSWVERYDRERAGREVARWQAGYQFSRAAQAQDTACALLGLSYREFEDRVRERLGRAEPRLGMGQTVSGFTSMSDWESNRVRKLESALVVVTMQLTSVYADAVARGTGLTYTQAYNALETLRYHLERDLRARLGTPDPETVLPGEY